MDENKQIEEMGLAICKSRGASNGEGCEWCGGDELCLYQQIAMSLYGAGYRKQEWISVEERLPEEKVMVLGFHHTVFKGGGHYDLVLVTELQNGLFVPFNCSPVKNGSVTHWMPLPDAPKGE